MTNEENKKQQAETENSFLENFLPDENVQKKQTQNHRNDFEKPEVDEEALLKVIAGDEPTETEQPKPTAKNSKRTTSKPKKLTKEDYCEQFFKIPNTIASKGKSVYVREEYHEKFNRFTKTVGVNKLTIYAYLDNIIEHHFQEFEELIREIYNEHHKPL